MSKHSIKRQQAHIYYTRHQAEEKLVIDQDKAYNLQTALKIKDYLYKKAITEENTKLANEIHNDKTKLQGLHEQTKTAPPPVAIQINIAK
jgi:hypothetical protein